MLLRLLAAGAAGVALPSTGLAAAGATAGSGGGQPPCALRERIEAAAGDDVGILVVAASGVKVLDPSGRLIRTLWPRAGGTGRRQSNGTTPSEGWPGLTADNDYSGALFDPDDIDDADDPRVADESTPRSWGIDEPGRNHGAAGHPTAGARPPPPLAVAGGIGWIAREDGVWRIDLRSGGATRIPALDGARVQALAAGAASGPAATARPTLLVVDRNQLLAVRDGETALHRLGVGEGAAPVRRVAVLAGGTVLALQPSGRLRVLPSAPYPRLTLLPLPRRIDDVVGCGKEALVLANGRVFRLSGSGDSIEPAVLAPPGAERLFCNGDGLWLALGAALHVSTDGGQTWAQRRGPNIGPIQTLIPTRRALWIAVPAGLWPLPATNDRTGAGQRRTAPVAAHHARAPRAADWSPPSSFWRRWSALLPVVDVQVELGRSGPVRETRGLICASFRLDGLWAAGGPPRPRGGAPVERPLGPLAGVANELDLLAAGAADPIAAEEQRALARIVEESP